MQSQVEHSPVGAGVPAIARCPVPKALTDAPLSPASRRLPDRVPSDEIFVSFANMTFYLGSVQPFIGKMLPLL